MQFTYLSTCGEENTVALDVPVDNSLWMQESQSFQHRTAHTGHLLLCQTREKINAQPLLVTLQSIIYGSPLHVP